MKMPGAYRNFPISSCFCCIVSHGRERKYGPQMGSGYLQLPRWNWTASCTEVCACRTPTPWLGFSVCPDQKSVRLTSWSWGSYRSRVWATDLRDLLGRTWRNRWLLQTGCFRQSDDEWKLAQGVKKTEVLQAECSKKSDDEWRWLKAWTKQRLM